MLLFFFNFIYLYSVLEDAFAGYNILGCQLFSVLKIYLSMVSWLWAVLMRDWSCSDVFAFVGELVSFLYCFEYYFFALNVFMCVYIRVLHVCECVYVEAQDRCITSFLITFPPYSLRQRVSVQPRVCQRGLSCQSASSGGLLFLSSETGSPGHCHAPGAFLWVSGDLNSSS